ncbi:MAG TPA: hypothetical protein VGT00_01300 [Methylomirabilota bacterium]|jgi:hypothetical protein|nr:hypothetical protein [Methylomirabilota bacterium]
MTGDRTHTSRVSSQINPTVIIVIGSGTWKSVETCMDSDARSSIGKGQPPPGSSLDSA